MGTISRTYWTYPNLIKFQSAVKQWVNFLSLFFSLGNADYNAPWVIIRIKGEYYVYTTVVLRIKRIMISTGSGAVSA